MITSRCLPKWLWEDIGNYYGAGAYGLSVFDNTFEIHFRTSGDGSKPEITRIVPDFSGYELVKPVLLPQEMPIMDIFSQLLTLIKAGSQGQYPLTGMILFLKPQFLILLCSLQGFLTDMLDSAGITVSGNPQPQGSTGK